VVVKKVMNLRILLIFSLVWILSDANIVWAHENHKNPNPASFLNQNHTVHSKENGDAHRNQEDGSDHVEGVVSDEHSNHQEGIGHKEHQGKHEEDHNHEEQGGHGEKVVMEQPANKLVLGTFGAINLFFLFIGVWNKWVRRKGGNNVSYSK
jgi:hypothetical protein